MALSPTYAALLEVMVASRTDRPLRTALRQSRQHYETVIIDLVLEAFPFLADDLQAARDLMTLALSLLQGAALTQAAGFTGADQSVRVARGLFATVTPATYADIANTLKKLSAPTNQGVS